MHISDISSLHHGSLSVCSIHSRWYSLAYILSRVIGQLRNSFFFVPREEIPYKRSILQSDESIPDDDCLVEVSKTGSHITLISYDEVTHIEKIFIFLEAWNLHRKLHQEVELMLDMRIMLEEIIDTIIPMDHRLRVEMRDTVKGALISNIRSHDLDNSRNLRSLEEKYLYQGCLFARYRTMQIQKYAYIEDKHKNYDYGDDNLDIHMLRWYSWRILLQIYYWFL